MRKSATIGAWVVGLGLLLPGGRAGAIAVGDLFPDVAVSGAAAKTLNKAALTGKVTVVNFWATWCAACKVELVEMREKFKPLLKNNKFQVAFVSVDKESGEAMKWARQNLKESDDFVRSLYLDPEFKMVEALSVESFPATFVLDQTGKIQHIQNGYVEGQPSTDQIVAKAQGLLK